MARILICTHPFMGHVNPALVMTRKLVQSGHDVRFYTGAKFKAKVEAAGAVYVPMKQARDFDDANVEAAFPERSKFKGVEQFKFDVKHVFIDAAAGEVADMRELFTTWMPDVVLSDLAFVGAMVMYEHGEIPAWAVFNVTVLGLPSRDVPPFGLGMLPDYSMMGKLKNLLLSFMAEKVVFREVNAHVRQKFIELGIAPRPFAPMFSPMLYLQPTVPAFEYPRTDLPDSVHFIGPLLPDLKGDHALPVWWNDVVNSTKPVVLVTQGTLATHSEDLIVPALQALADEDVLVVATVDPNTLNIPVPSNVRMEKFIPFDKLMPHVDVMVTNGGYGGVTIALAQGVPVICAGNTEDKAEVGNRAAYTGVGINLKTNQPTPQQVNAAVKTVLLNSQYKVKAMRMQEEFAKQDGASEAVRLVEQLLNTRQPVVNPQRDLKWQWA